MKKNLLLFVFSAFMTLFAANAFAVDYGLWIAGVRVTDANKDTITAAIVAAGRTASGVITYNSATNTLTLDNAYINTSERCINHSIANLTINLVGENTLKTTTDAVTISANTTITGSGSLTVETTNNASAMGQPTNVNTTLTIDNTIVTISGGSGYNGGNKGNIVVNNSIFRATGSNTGYGSINRCNSLTLNGCAIVQPTGATFDASQKAVCSNGEIVRTEIVIEPLIYDLYVAGVQVTAQNKDDITSAVVAAGQTATGTISYNPTTKTLTLNNATISTATYSIDNIGIKNLKINLIGNNKVISSNKSSVASHENFSITGNDSLELSSRDFGIYAYECNLTIEGVTITATGRCGIVGRHGSNEILTIKNAIIKATGTSGAIYDFKEIKLEGCVIIQPSGAVFNSGAVKLNGSLAKEVVIAPVYDLYVAGVHVTDANKDDILGDGKVSYNSATNTLTLDNASISATGALNDGIENLREYLTINLIGNNTITSDVYGVHSRADVKIIGNDSLTGSLTITSNLHGIWQESCNLTIENATVTASNGISGTDNELLTIKNSTVKATGANEGSMIRISNLVLNDCVISQPTGAVFDASQKAVCLNGEIVKTEVVIIPAYDLYVGFVQVTDANKDDITAAINQLGTTGTSATGTITYDPTTNTLTLNNATISHDGNTITNYIENLKINLIGNNKAIATQSASVASLENFSIIGNGSLETISTSNSALFAGHCSLTIEGVTITAIGKWGISGNSTPGNKILTIKNATIKATGTSGSICYFKEIKLEGCAITQPSGAVFDRGEVRLNSRLVTEEVVIEPNSDGVKETIADQVKIRMQNRQLTVENSNRQAIAVYNVMGQLIATRYNPGETETIVLPAAGVYIVKVGKGATKVVAL